MSNIAFRVPTRIAPAEQTDGGGSYFAAPNTLRPTMHPLCGSVQTKPNDSALVSDLLKLIPEHPPVLANAMLNNRTRVPPYKDLKDDATAPIRCPGMKTQLVGPSSETLAILASADRTFPSAGIRAIVEDHVYVSVGNSGSFFGRISRPVPDRKLIYVPTRSELETALERVGLGNCDFGVEPMSLRDSESTDGVAMTGHSRAGPPLLTLWKEGDTVSRAAGLVKYMAEKVNRAKTLDEGVRILERLDQESPTLLLSQTFGKSDVYEIDQAVALNVRCIEHCAAGETMAMKASLAPVFEDKKSILSKAADNKSRSLQGITFTRGGAQLLIEKILEIAFSKAKSSTHPILECFNCGDDSLFVYCVYEPALSAYHVHISKEDAKNYDRSLSGKVTGATRTFLAEKRFEGDKLGASLLHFRAKPRRVNLISTVIVRWGDSTHGSWTGNYANSVINDFVMNVCGQRAEKASVPFLSRKHEQYSLKQLVDQIEGVTGAGEAITAASFGSLGLERKKEEMSSFTVQEEEDIAFAFMRQNVRVNSLGCFIHAVYDADGKPRIVAYLQPQRVLKSFAFAQSGLSAAKPYIKKAAIRVAQAGLLHGAGIPPAEFSNVHKFLVNETLKGLKLSEQALRATGEYGVRFQTEEISSMGVTLPDTVGSALIMLQQGNAALFLPSDASVSEYNGSEIIDPLQFVDEDIGFNVHLEDPLAIVDAARIAHIGPLQSSIPTPDPHPVGRRQPTAANIGKRTPISVLPKGGAAQLTREAQSLGTAVKKGKGKATMYVEEEEDNPYGDFDPPDPEWDFHDNPFEDVIRDRLSKQREEDDEQDLLDRLENLRESKRQLGLDVEGRFSASRAGHTMEEEANTPRVQQYLSLVGTSTPRGSGPGGRGRGGMKPPGKRSN